MDRQELVTVLRAPARAIRARAGIFVLIVAGVVAMNLVLPPFVLSVVRKPYDYFSINPWLHNVPSWLRSGEATAGRKVEFLWNASILWFVGSVRDDRAPLGCVPVSRLGRDHGCYRQRRAPRHAGGRHVEIAGEGPHVLALRQGDRRNLWHGLVLRNHDGQDDAGPRNAVGDLQGE